MTTKDNGPGDRKGPVAANVAGTETGSSEEDGPRKRGKRAIVVWGATVVALALLAGGALVWHAQPTFCNAFCHEPMDSYVDGYYAGDSTLLLTAHADSRIECLDCHEAKLSDQLTELRRWASGDYEVDATDRILDDTIVIGTKDFCWACHNDDDAASGEDWEAIKAATEDWGGASGANPHASHQGLADCRDCHDMHGTSELSCNACHSFAMPEGWVAAAK